MLSIDLVRDTKTLPTDNRKFFIVTEYLEVVQVQFDEEASFWLPATQYTDVDEERGRRFDPSEIRCWSESWDVAEDAAAMLEEFLL